MKIKGPEQAKLRKAILNEFSYLDFQLVLNDRLNQQLNNIAPPMVNFENQLAETIIWLNNRSWIPQLMSALTAERPDSEDFRNLSYQWEMLLPITYLEKPDAALSKSALESLVNSGPLFNINVLIGGIVNNKRCVCRVKVIDDSGNARYGTGFLVGEDMLLSNHHVFEPVIKNPALAAHVVCKFDYEVDASGNTINPGIDLHISDHNPVLSSSPPCSFDLYGTPDVNVDWPTDCLDYALVKMADRIGSLPYGLNGDKTSSPTAATRGWVKKSTTPVTLFKGSNIIIIQYPDRGPMKIALGPRMIVGCDDNEMRVRYTVNTMEGSSGSPCFDADFNRIALHNMGDLNYSAKYNQGIPADRIIADLQINNINL